MFFKAPLSILYFIISLLLLLVIPIWSIFIAPELKKLPDNFTYSANILSLDNFYDEKEHKFEGEHLSKTIFNYDVISKKPSYLIIRNSFTVRKLSDKPIISVSRLYYINPYDERHVSVIAGEGRNGYLFAPRYVNQQDFYYWHVNYDAPALMKFIDVTQLDGLKVYHYQAQYEADQTNNLSYLPGVPEKRGIKANIILQLWVEPITGWLVKYQDNTLAYYYDRTTGMTIAPWNSFSNRYTQNSIHEQIQRAIKLKWKILFIDAGVPFFLFLLSLSLMYAGYLNQKQRLSSKELKRVFKFKSRLSVFHLLILFFVVIFIESVYYILTYKKSTMIYKIGISQWNNNSELLDAIKGFKDSLAAHGYREGINVTYDIKNPETSIEKQIAIIQSFVHEKMSLIYTLTTPGTLVAKGITTKIPIVFTDVTYPEEAEIINATSSSKNNLIGVRNYISPAQQYYQFERLYPNTKVLGFIHRKGDPDAEIQYQEFKSILNKRNINVLDIPAIDLDDVLKKLKLQKNQFNALFIACDTLMRSGGGKIAANFTLQYKIPSFTCDKSAVTSGALVGYFADLYLLGILAGNKAALILDGSEPSWLITESPARGYLMINQHTAQLLGIVVSPSILKRADTVIGSSP